MPPSTASTPRYTLRQLRYFVATAEALSFTAASRAMHVSQPSISTALADLEACFGVQLFLRHHASGLSLTSAGHDMLGRVRDLLKNAEELQIAAGDLDSGTRGQIAVGCLVTLAPHILPLALSRFMQTHRGIDVTTVETHQQGLIESLHDGRLDIGLTFDLDIPQEVLFTPLVDLPPFVILPKGHRLADGRPVSLGELRDEPYVMLDLPHSREYFASLFVAVGPRPAAAYRSSQLEVVRGMVAHGLGYAILNFPLRSTTTVDGRQFVVCAIREPVRPMRLGIARLRSLRARKAVQLFEAFCREQLPRVPLLAEARPAGGGGLPA